MRPYVGMYLTEQLPRDLLTRHAAIHTNDDAEEESSSQTRSRFSGARKVSRACKACVAAKAKCVGGMPCRRCMKRGMACLPRASAQRARDLGFPEDEGLGETPADDDLSVDQAASANATSSVEQRASAQGSRLYIPEDSVLEETRLGGNPSAIQMSSANATSSADEKARNSRPQNDTGYVPSVDAQISGADETRFDLPTTSAVNFTPDFLDLEPYLDADFGGFDLLNLITDTGWEKLITAGRIRRASKAFKDSVWYSTSDRKSNHNRGAARDLGAFTGQEESEAFARGLHSAIPQRFTQSTRDSLLVSLALLAQHQSPDFLKILQSGFPTSKLLNVLVHLFLSRQNRKVDSWIHSASFQPNETNVELTTMIIATSALNTTFPTLRKLGTELRQLLRSEIIKEVGLTPHRLLHAC